jgi:propanol-preferring alcohol dehydrogenase
VVADQGRIVQVGLGRPEATIKTQLVTMKQLDLLGSLGGMPEDTVEVLKFIESGELNIATEVISFEDIAEGLERLHQGKAAGKRLVASINQ